MRIATSQFQASMNRSLNTNQEQISKLTAQMASGSRIQVPSDDPVNNVRISRLNREEAILGQHRANIDAVKIRLQKNETYLTSVVGDINQVRDLMVWALDGGGTQPDDLQSMVQSLESLRDSMLYSANVKDAEGRYVFSGTLTDTPAITFDESAAPGSRYSYTGNNNKQQVVVGNGIAQTANVDVQGLETYLNRIDAVLGGLETDGVSSNDPAMRELLKDALTGSDTAMSLISGKIAEFGGAQNILSTLADNHGNVSLSNQMAMTDLGKLDYGLAATELNGYNIALQSTYKAYAKVSNLSLFNVL
ncbi:flagellar hook-associated protein FlgL [Pseudoduganella namucuonensis]|uniref:Flagellar hook-associated protein 3 FlgL n=1 Tax=Pseudoduganella namucuonensis TaxID=1035707 RepID=A0A1I7HVF5_9BURK|nr:flagellar hook-associated protein FlgL [Pseudoduganella namucuonensis]SFU64476.1 flagellar hook-associated protein 3 FlgL [Pseudoduganella namucuonensis]